MAGFVFIVIIVFVLISSLDKKKQVNRNLSSSRSVKKGIAPNVTVSSKTTPTSNTIIKAIPVDGSPINKIQNEDAVSHSTVNTVMNILNKSNLNSNAVKPILEIDDSIIDVTNEVYKISSEKLPTEPKINVVPWLHRYIYSYSDLESATEDQRKFYVSFRYYFLKGKCLDLEGNDNYAFVLLFHLFKDYDQHGSIEKLKDDLYILSEKYPKTKPYCSSLLAKKLAPVTINEQGSSYGNSYYSNEWYLGNKFKNKLKLDNESVELLNKIYTPHNNFCEIEFCLIEVLKLFLTVVSELKNKYVVAGTNLETEFKAVGDVVAKKQFKYRDGSSNYKYSIESTSREMYPLIFKCTENAVREFYGHKRKINVDIYSNEEAALILESKVISHVNSILASLNDKIAEIDEPTDILLNSKNTSRWKNKFEILTKEFKCDIENFSKEINSLAKLNAKNPSIENIYFEASKFISKSDKKSALVFYIHYLFYDLRSDNFDNKQLTKTIQKSLFKNSEQLREFEIVVSELIKNKNLENAIQSVSKIYEVKRKKIKLDTISIVEVQEQHSETVELLNTYLQDEFEDEANSIKSTEVGTNEIQIEIISKAPHTTTSVYLDSLMFEEIHLSTLDIFVKSNFTVPANEFAEFSKSKGVLKNQVIDSLNEKCFDCLDDVLIEEEPEYYTIEPNYYKKLLRL